MKNPAPISEWADRKSGRKFQTVTVRQDDGTFLSVIADHPEIRFTSRSAKASQKA
jgi:hypothetical protein